MAQYPYLVVADAVRAKIRTGELRPGQKIDTLSLAKELQVNRATVQRGLSVLEAEGLVTVLRAYGTFVAEEPPKGS